MFFFDWHRVARWTSLLFCWTLLPGTASLISIVWAGSTRLVHPEKRDLEPRHHRLIASPAEFGLKLESETVKTHDGIELSAILATLATSPGTADKTRRMASRLGRNIDVVKAVPIGTAVFLHGHGGCKEDMLSIAQRFVAADYRCIVYDARAHGQSGGRACTFGHHETRDLSGVLNHFSDILHARGEALGQVCAVGNSLGASVLLQSLPQEPRINVAIAVAPFANHCEVATLSAKRILHPGIPDWLIDTTLQVGGKRGGFDPFAISPLGEVGLVTTPIFFAHGALDQVIPASHSARLHSSAREPKELRIIAGGNHTNVLAEGGDDLYQDMIEFCLKMRQADKLGVPIPHLELLP